MIEFDLTEENLMLEQSVREWSAAEVAPEIRQLDREHRFDESILKKMGDSRTPWPMCAEEIRWSRDGLCESRSGK